MHVDYTYTFTAGVTQTIASLAGDGTAVIPITVKSSSAGSAATLSLSGSNTRDYWKVQDITKSGAGSLTITHGQDVSGNTNITFTNAYDWNSRYWIGGTGNWTDRTHWAVTSGGTGGAQLPTATEDVYFDANSFSAASQTVTITSTTNFKNFTWTGATNSPTFTSDGNNTINCYGSFTLIANMTFTLIATDSLNFRSTSAGTTVTSAGKAFACDVAFNGTGGVWALQDAFNIGSRQLTLTAGTLNTNDVSVTCGDMNISGTTTRTLTLATSTVTCTSWTATTVTNLTLTATSALIVMTGSNTFAGGGKTYGRVQFTGTTCTISGNNTFKEIICSAGKTLKITASSTQTLTAGEVGISGGDTEGSLAIITSTSTTNYTISCSSGTVRVWYFNIAYCTASGGATFNAVNSTQGTNTTGWTFNKGAHNLPALRGYVNMVREVQPDAMSLAIAMPTPTYALTEIGTPTLNPIEISSDINPYLAGGTAYNGNQWVMTFDNNGIMYVAFEYISSGTTYMRIKYSTDTTYSSFNTHSNPTSHNLDTPTLYLFFDTNNDMYAVWKQASNSSTAMSFYDGSWTTKDTDESITGGQHLGGACKDIDGNIYVARSRNVGSVYYQAYVSIIEAGETTFTRYGAVESTRQSVTEGGSIAPLSGGGVIYAYPWYEYGVATVAAIYVKTTTNIGVSWSSRTLALAGGGTYSLVSPQIVVAPDGSLHIIAHEEQSGHYDMYYACSTDDGATWSNAVKIYSSTTNSIINRPAMMALSENDVYILLSSSVSTYHIELIRKTQAGWADPFVYIDNVRVSGLAIMQNADSQNRVWYAYSLAVDDDSVVIDYINFEVTRTAVSVNGTDGQFSHATYTLSEPPIENTATPILGEDGMFSQATYSLSSNAITKTATPILGEDGMFSQATYDLVEAPAIVWTATPMLAVDGMFSQVNDAFNSLYPIEYSIEILEYQSTETAEADTSTSVVKITDHGLVALDMVVNTTCRTRLSERGARLVHDTGLDDDTIPYATNMTNQAEGDSIRLYKYVDRTSLVKPATFRLVRKGGGQSTLVFEIITTSAYLIQSGQYVRVRATQNGVSSFVFYGVVSSHSEELLGAAQVKIKQSIECVGLNSVAARRSIVISETEGATYGSIVEKMVDDYLFQEGIRKGTIDTGKSLTDDWENDVISIKDVLDECATKSGYQWFIDDSANLQFYDEHADIPGATHRLNSSWSNYWNLKFFTDSTNYYNKIIISGNDDDKGNTVLVSYEDYTQSTAKQEITAGTGVFGVINHDANQDESDYRIVESSSTTDGVTTITITGHGQAVGDVIVNYTRGEQRQILSITSDTFDVDAFSGIAGWSEYTAEAGTTTTNIKITGHGLVVGQMIYNEDRDAYRFILAKDNDNITVEAVSGQTTGDKIKKGGDLIAFYDQANDQLQSLYKKQSVEPTTLSFITPEYFVPITKMEVNLPAIGQSTAYYLIEDVEIYDTGRGLSECWYKVTASKRNSELTTQRKINYTDFWRDW
jgi:hypothetical protein